MAFIFFNIEGSVTQGADIQEGLEMTSDVLRIQLSWNVEHGIALPKTNEYILYVGICTK